MEKGFKKTFLWSAFVFAYWILECFEMQVFFKTYVYFVAFSVSIAILYFVKKEGVALIGLLAVSLLTTIYQYEYLFTVLPVVLLCYAHCSVIKGLKEKKNKKKATEGLADTYTTMSFILMVVQVVYSLVTFQNTQPHRAYNILYILKMSLAFILLFVFLIILAYSKKDSKDNEIDIKTQNSLRIIYITSLFGTVITILTFYAVNGYDTQSYNTEYIFWFVFVMLMVLDKDPYIYEGIEKLEKWLSNL